MSTDAVAQKVIAEFITKDSAQPVQRTTPSAQPKPDSMIAEVDHLTNQRPLANGNRIWIDAPPPARLEAQMWPLCSFTDLSAIASPTPTPPV